MRLILNHRVALQPSVAAPGHRPLAARRAVLGERRLRQLHVPAEPEPAAPVLLAAVVGPHDREREAVDREVHVDEAHGEAADLQVPLHGDRYLLRHRVAARLHREPDGVVSVGQQRRVEHAQHAAADRLSAGRERDVLDRLVLRVVVVAFLHRGIGQRVLRHAVGRGGTDDLRRRRHDAHVRRCGDVGRGRRRCGSDGPDGGNGLNGAALRRGGIRLQGCTKRPCRRRLGGSEDVAPPSARKGGEGQKLEEQGEHDQGGRKSSGLVTHETPPSFVVVRQAVVHRAEGVGKFVSDGTDPSGVVFPIGTSFFASGFGLEPSGEGGIGYEKARNGPVGGRFAPAFGGSSFIGSALGAQPRMSMNPTSWCSRNITFLE